MAFSSCRLDWITQLTLVGVAVIGSIVVFSSTDIFVGRIFRKAAVQTRDESMTSNALHEVRTGLLSLHDLPAGDWVF